jgi:GTP cyclohydrolase I
VDNARIERAVREILAAIGEDPDREGLIDTPARVARAYGEMFAGMQANAGVHLTKQFDQEQAGDDAVMLRNIPFTSMCEHHLLPFTGRAHVAYLPQHGKVTGLSKLARTVDVFAKRPQLQERLTAQIANALVEHLDPRGVAVVVEAEHSCLKLRGAEKHEADMVTTAFRGSYERDRELRSEILQLMRVGG